MKGCLLISVLIAVFVSPIAFARESDEAPAQARENMERRLQMQRVRRRAQAEQGEMEFSRQMRRMELEERRMGLEKHHMELDKHKKMAAKMGKKHHDDDGGKIVFLVVCLIVHILLAVWVFGDIRSRGKGSGIWIVIVLLAGLLGVLPYTIVRLGDTRQTSS